MIPVCIRGLHDKKSLYAYGDQKQSLYAYGDLLDPRMHTGIGWTLIPVCVRGFAHPCMHTGIFQSLTVCIREMFPYGILGLLSPYA
jgi:hypothetical protein